MWLSTISGVALGGFLVFKTKRDPYEPLFSANSKGESFNIDDDLNMGDVESVIPQSISKANDNFQKQFDVDKFASEIGKKAK